MIDVNLPVELDDGRPARYVSFEEAIEKSYVSFEEDYEEGAALFEIVGQESRRGPVHSTAMIWWYTLDTGIWNGGSASDHFVLRNLTDRNEYEPDL